MEPTNSNSHWIADEISALTEVARIHHQNFAFFQKLIWPAVLFAAVILQLSVWQSSEMKQSVPGMSSHVSELFSGVAVRLTGLFADWLFYCFAFAGTATAVREILMGNNPEPEDSLNNARAKFVRLLPLTSILFLLVLLVCIGSGFVAAACMTLRHQTGGIPLSVTAVELILAISILLGFTALSRFALAIPALIVDGLPLWKSFRRSDELTEGHMLLLIVLICESVLGGYLALQLPFWIWNYAFASHVVLTWTIYWILRLIGLALSAAVQPFMFVGFSYLYLTARMPEEPEPVPTGFAVWSSKMSSPTLTPKDG